MKNIAITFNQKNQKKKNHQVVKKGLDGDGSKENKTAKATEYYYSWAYK